MPRVLAIAGFDGGSLFKLAIATIGQPVAELARVAVKRPAQHDGLQNLQIVLRVELEFRAAR